jgi:hypothetical protein
VNAPGSSLDASTVLSAEDVLVWKLLNTPEYPVIPLEYPDGYDTVVAALEWATANHNVLSDPHDGERLGGLGLMLLAFANELTSGVPCQLLIRYTVAVTRDHVRLMDTVDPSVPSAVR